MSASRPRNFQTVSNHLTSFRPRLDLGLAIHFPRHVQNMSNPDPNTIRQAAAAFPVKQAARFESLHPWRDVIGELRGKRASFHTITEFLNQYGIGTSKSTVASFCKEVLKETLKRKAYGRQARSRPSPKVGTSQIVPPTSPTPAGNSPSDSQLALLPDRSGHENSTSTPRRRGPRIANIELIDD
jgi:hypothetical protein